MAYICDNCGKGRIHGHNVSHAKNRTHRLFLPNLQTVSIVGEENRAKSVRLCTKCIKRMRKDGKIASFIPKINADKSAKVTTPSTKHIDREEKKVQEVLKKEAKKAVKKSNPSISLRVKEAKSKEAKAKVQV
ncbi:MAG: 50S ribosomal protein L28 [Candidatus Gottesmanbacteria bacterium GW2011_GWC2_39_8]|uniref:Large ribosomal subunit protein bL28 n=1 Tax=Candidatus Gottesmanbacteria bacterium GW2011_GWC2_39_8 TaxID=1618450 RepID=A0A0G0Q4Y6_9BACT|nr:MAG: 50S ribosomal protein L28 [Candidatus Gottesmanbacteria bacterium GW2011_GWC2_39_8]